MGHLLKIKWVDSRVNVHNLASTSGIKPRPIFLYLLLRLWTKSVVMVGEVFTAYRALYKNNFYFIFWRAECVGHSFAYVTNFVFLRDVWIRTQRAGVARCCATKLATHTPCLAAHLPY
jgi:hypothetical protein